MHVGFHEISFSEFVSIFFPMALRYKLNYGTVLCFRTSYLCWKQVQNVTGFASGSCGELCWQHCCRLRIFTSYPWKKWRIASTERNVNPKTDRNLQEKTSEPQNCYSGMFCLNQCLETHKSSAVFCFFLVSNRAAWAYSELAILREFARVHTSLLKKDHAWEFTRFKGTSNALLGVLELVLFLLKWKDSNVAGWASHIFLILFTRIC